MVIAPCHNYIQRTDNLESGYVSKSFLFFPLFETNNSTALLNAFINVNEAKQREQYRFYLEGKRSAMDNNRYKMLSEVGFNWSVKGRKCAQIESLGTRVVKEGNVSLDSFPEGYHSHGVEEGEHIDVSTLMTTKSPFHVLMGDYNESPQEIAERAIESLQRTHSANENLEVATDVDILLVDA